METTADKDYLVRDGLSEWMSNFFTQCLSITAAEAGWIVTLTGDVLFGFNIRFSGNEVALEQLVPVLQKLKQVQLNQPSPYNSALVIPVEIAGVAVVLFKDEASFTSTEIKRAVFYQKTFCKALDNLQLMVWQVEALPLPNHEHLHLIDAQEWHQLQNEDINLAACVMAEAITGGDIVSIQYSSTQNILKCAVGDVSGKGPASVYDALAAKTFFDFYAGDFDDPSLLAASANRFLSAIYPRNRFISCFIAFINLNINTLTYSRAGHCPAYFFRSATEQWLMLDEEGTGLAIIRKGGYDETTPSATITLQNGDILAVFTDGITEARGSSPKRYGYKKLLCALDEHRLLKPTQMVASVLADIDNFTAAANCYDDQTLLVCKI